MAAFTPVAGSPGGDGGAEERAFRLAVEVPDVLDADECDRLIAAIAELGQVEGEIAREDGRGADLDREVRRVRQTVLRRDAGNEWVYARLAAAVDRCNQAVFGFEIEEFAEPAVVVDYRRGDFYDWHLDLGREARFRKLSVSVALSPPDDYDGGALAFPGLTVASPARGSAVVFPSFVLHGVQPVTRGRRCALVAWVAGPPFR